MPLCICGDDYNSHHHFLGWCKACSCCIYEPAPVNPQPDLDLFRSIVYAMAMAQAVS